MKVYRHIERDRREYNQWVANQTLEDYALRFTAKGARRWSAFRVANTAIGGISFLALEAIGGAITLTYGFSNAIAAILVVGAIIFALGLPITTYAARYGVDIDLLTRGAGFGYLGSTITSLIYASFTFIFFAIEAAIMAKALEMSLGVPEVIGFIVSSVIVIPLVTYGFTFISGFQLWTQPLWLTLHVIPFIVLALFDDGTFTAWKTFTGRLGRVDGAFDLVLFGSASGVVFALVAQIGEQVDFLRFLPERKKGEGFGWWVALIGSGPGWIILGVFKMIAGSFLAYLAFRAGVPPGDAADPTRMYAVAFERVTGHPQTALALAAIFVVISQLKINVTNAYAGSIAWSNFFSRLTHSHPGRVVWVVFNVMIALLLMELGVYRSLEHTLGIYSHVAVAWVGAIFADLVINKPLGLSPPGIEFQRAHLHDINPVGIGAMVGASALSIPANLGLFGPLPAALSCFIALASAIVLAPLIAYLTRGAYYLARQPSDQYRHAGSCACAICVNRFEAEDIAHCPAYDAPICSLCCTLNARCHDSCKAQGRAATPLAGFVDRWFSPRWIGVATSSLGRYLSLLLLVCSITGGVMALVYWQSAAELDATQRSGLALGMLKIFLGLVIIAGVVCWLYVLAHESREFAQQESEHQALLLMQEIEAHEKTDRELQAAKEIAEAANLAKSRYLVGISHEFRTPLNSILGYAQLLERGELETSRHDSAIRTIRRSGEHLAGLVDGLLDIAKIEAGRFELSRDVIAFPEFIKQITDMFRIQAESKGIEFRFDHPERIPSRVRTDEKRLRQILINLLSNAVKFTERGHVRFALRFRNDVVEFTVSDTGIGIAPSDMTRIFVPFERIENPAGPWVPGTGLGLTITKLMTEMMGGVIKVQSRLGEGSQFSVRLHLPAVGGSVDFSAARGRIIGYQGPARTILVVDDEAAHRQLAVDILEPLGFVMRTCPDAAACLAAFEEHAPDLVLLDVTMPGMDGWALARALREDKGFAGCILMLSAAAHGESAMAQEPRHHNGFIVKPVEVGLLLEEIRRHAGIEWLVSETLGGPARVHQEAAKLSPRALRDLQSLASLGMMLALGRRLAELEREEPEADAFLKTLARHAATLEVETILSLLEAALDDPAIRQPA